MRITIEGIDNVMDMLNDKLLDMTEKMSKGIAKGCEIVKAEAKALCPVSTQKTRPPAPDGQPPHGELRQSITSQVSGLEGTVGTNKEYAGYVEFGTCKMAAQPYLVPALKNQEGAVIDAIKAAVGL